jgi:DNA primase
VPDHRNLGTDFGNGDDAKSRVLQATNLVELIGQSVKLQRRGRDFLGLCPFHQEKTPSFHVKPDKQFFYCFGCKAAGNAIDFVIKRDRVQFKEALIGLAKAANIELPNWSASRENASERQILLEAHSAASGFFENLLRDPQRGKAARDYLAGRGFNEESIKRFQIGLAADSWDALVKSPAMRKFTPAQLAQAGLAKSRDGGGVYDTFRNRLMFPIRDEGGRTIGFGGRVMPGSEDPAKYLNSPETPLFSKGRVAFGMDLARQKIVETRTVAVVEGYTDVIMAHQYGASNVVSVLGTAMTSDHVRLLKRFADRIVLLFDADAAGDKAVDRAVELFLTQPVEVAIASMPDGKDPDEFVLEYGAEGFTKLLDGAQDALSYKWKQLAREFSASQDNLTGQQGAIEAYLKLLAGARGLGPIDQLRWGMALARVSRLTQIPVEDLDRHFTKQPIRRPSRGRSPERRTSNNRTGHDAGMPEGYSSAAAQGNEGEMPTVAVPGTHVRSGQAGGPVGSRSGNRASPTKPAERWILGILLLEPARWHQVQTQVRPEDFSDPDLRRLAEIYWAHQRDEGEPVFNELLGQLDEAGQKELAIGLLTEVEEQVHRDQALSDAVAKLIGRHAEAERWRVQASLDAKSSDEEGNLRRIMELRGQRPAEAKKPK